jgi:hypothetical protein
VPGAGEQQRGTAAGQGRECSGQPATLDCAACVKNGGWEENESVVGDGARLWLRLALAEGAGLRTGRIHAGQVLRLGRPEGERARSGQATAAAACFTARRRPARDFSRHTPCTAAQRRRCVAVERGRRARAASLVAARRWRQAPPRRNAEGAIVCVGDACATPTYNLSLHTAAPRRCVHMPCCVVVCRPHRHVDGLIPLSCEKRVHGQCSIIWKRGYAWLPPVTPGSTVRPPPSKGRLGRVPCEPARQTPLQLPYG